MSIVQHSLIQSAFIICIFHMSVHVSLLLSILIAKLTYYKHISSLHFSLFQSKPS